MSNSTAVTKSVQTGVIVPEPNEAGDGLTERQWKGTSSGKGYVVSISGKRKVRRLHYVGLCHRVPGLDFPDYECYDDEQPRDTLYDDYCH